MPNAARFARGALVVAAVAMLVDSAAAAPGPSRREARRRTRDLCAQQVNAEDPPLHSAEVGLSELAMSGIDARRGMLAVVEDRDPRIAACVAEFLMRIDEPQVRQILRRRLRTAKPSEFAALDLLADVADPAALPAALSLSSSSNATARHSAVVALGRFDEPRARARLRAMLAAETDLYAVASSLGQLRDIESVPALAAHALRAQPPFPRSMLSVAAALVRIGTSEALGAAAQLVARHPPSLDLDEALAPAVDDLRSRRDLGGAAERWTQTRIDLLVALTQRAEVLPYRVQGQPITQEATEAIARASEASRAWARLDGIDHPRARELVRATAAEGAPVVLAGLTTVASTDVLITLVRGDRLPDDRSRSALAWNLYHRCHRACLDDILLAFTQIRGGVERFEALASALHIGPVRCRDAVPIPAEIQDACREVKRALSAMAVDPAFDGRFVGHRAQAAIDHPVILEPLLDRAMKGDMEALHALGERRDAALAPRLPAISAAAPSDDSRLEAIALAQLKTGTEAGAAGALETLARLSPCGVRSAAAAALAELQVQRSPRYLLESRLTDVTPYERALRALLATRCRA